MNAFIIIKRNLMTAQKAKPASPARGRPRRSAEATAEDRARILDAAQTLFAKGGYDGVSMRAVAELAGCSPAALYTLFPNKRALLRNIWEEAFAALADALEKSVRGRRDPINRLKRLGRAFVRFWLDHPDHFRAIFLIEDHVTEPGELYFVDTSQSITRLVLLFHGAAGDAISEGVLAAGQDVQEIIQLIFCALHGVASALISIPEFGWTSPQQMAGRMIDALLAGLAK